MKTVFTVREVPHIFAARQQDEGRNSNRTLWFEGDVLSSNAQPIAMFHGDVVLITSDSFSVTTGKHTSWARYALNHLESVSVPSLKKLQDVIKYRGERAALDYIAERIKDADAIRDKMKRMRADWKISNAQGEIATQERAAAIAWQAIGRQGDWREVFGAEYAAFKRAARIAMYQRAGDSLVGFLDTFTTTDKLEYCNASAVSPRERLCRSENTARNIRYADFIGALRGDGIGETPNWAECKELMPAEFVAQYRANVARLADMAATFQTLADELRPQLAELERAEHAEKIAQWMRGENVSLWGIGETLCRVINGDTVETSKGARVPLADAERVVRLAQRCRAAGETFQKQTFATGSYQGIAVDAEGNVTIGCHRMTYRAIAEAVATFKPELMESAE